MALLGLPEFVERITAGTNITVTTPAPGQVEISSADFLKLELGSTGWISGGELTINADPTLFDRAEGRGYIADQSADPVVLTEVSWPTVTGITVTNLATQAATDIAVNAAGATVQQLTYTTAQLRGLIFLGGLDHSGNTVINNTFPLQIPAGGIGSSLYELARAVGDIKTSGNVISAAGTDLTIAKSAGTTFSYGRNALTSATNPHTIAQGAQSPVSFNYVLDNGSGGSLFQAAVTDIDPDQYDGGAGAVAVVPNNRWSIQRVVMFSNTGKVFIQLGKTTYTKKEDAIDAILTTASTELSGVRSALTVSFLVVKKGTTNLASSDAVFVATDKFGSGLSGAASADSGITVQSGTNANGDWMIGYGPDDVVLWRWFRVVANGSASADVTVTTPITMGSTNYFVMGNKTTGGNVGISVNSTTSAYTATTFPFSTHRLDSGVRLAYSNIILHGFEFVVTA